MNLRSGLAAAGLLLAGCVSMQPETGERIIGPGPEPTPAEAEAAIRSVFYSTLKDPDSVKQFEMDARPRQIFWYRGVGTGGGHESAWLWCFSYNAKNSYGAYVGLRRDGLALRVADGSAYSVPAVIAPGDGC